MRSLDAQSEVLIPVAIKMLMTGPRSQKPTRRAVLKTVKWLKQSPLHAITPQHLRGSWRSL